jgi:hypothetical protein
MKTLNAHRFASFLLSITLLFAPVAIVSLSTGCNVPQQTIAYKTLASVQAAKDAALKAYAAAYVAHQVPPESYPKVNSALGKFQVAFAAAVDIARGDLNQPTPAQVQQLLNDLLAIIRTAGVKI